MAGPSPRAADQREPRLMGSRETQPLPPGAAPGEASELARLRDENRALGDQVRLLVQLEQRLYRSQSALDQELRRIRSLGAFALRLAGVTSSDAVLAEVGVLLHECFSLDRLALVRWDETGAVTISIGQRQPEPWPLGADELAALRAVPTVTLSPQQELEPALQAVFGRLCAQTVHVHCLALSAHPAPAVILALSVASKRSSHREDQLGEVHRPFLLLIATHLRRCLEYCSATEDLQARSAALAEVNARLCESLTTLERTQAQLIESSKMEAIGRLAGGVAHDFNNLLTVILNHAELVSSALPPASEAAEDLEQILDAGRRAAEITSQLLALGRKQLRTAAHLDLGSIAQETCRMLRSLLGRGLSLEVEAVPGCVVLADRTGVEQAVMNLVLNARDAMRQGGSVRVVVREATAAEVLALGASDTAMVALEVIDTGIGMDEATRARIFEPFFTTKPSEHGTGLGLAVVYGVVKHAGGQITVESTPGQGSRFSIFLPRRAEAAVPPPQVPRVPEAAQARVLVVEDNEPIRRVVSRILARAGYQVIEAADGVDALAKLAHASTLELVLTDLNMPRMGGFELAERLAELAPTTRILFMTGFSEELADASRRAPQWPCLTKPFTPSELLEQVRAHLAERC